MKVVKKFVPVVVKFDQDGMTPLQIFWNDGRIFDVDKVLDIRPAASIPAGGFGFGIPVGYRVKKRFYFMKNHGGLWKRKAQDARCRKF